MMTGNRLNRLDVAFLKLDTLASPMNIGAFAVFQPPHPIVVQELSELLAQRLGQVDRFRLRPRPVRFRPGTVVWETDPRYQVEAHIRVTYLAAPGTRDQLGDYVAQAVARQLDLAHPLWEVHLITGLDDGNFALLVKSHHALADGMGVGYLIAALMDDAPTPPTPAGDPAGQRVGIGDALRAVYRPDRWLTTPAAIATQLADRVTGSAQQAIRGLGVAASVLRGVRIAPSSPLLGAPGRISLRRRLHTVQLEREVLTEISMTYQVSTNDVVLAILAGALRQWLEDRGHPVEEVALRALVPVDLRGYNRTAVPGQGNELSGYLCELPVAEPNPVRRLKFVHEVMELNKADGPYRGPGALGFLATTLPAAVQSLTVPLAGQSAGLLFDILVTSGTVVGGRWPVAGAPMRENFGIPPLAKGQGLAVGVAKNKEFIGLSLLSDPSILPDAATLRDAVLPAVAELVSPVRVASRRTAEPATGAVGA